MHRPFQRRMAAAFSAALLLALAACGSSTDTASSSSAGPSGSAAAVPAPDVLHVGLFGPDVTFSAFYSAVGPDGALTKTLTDSNVQLDIQTITSGANLIAALQGGTVDMAVVPGSAAVAVAEKGGAIQPLMGLFDGPSQVVVAKKADEQTNGTNVASFNGQRWGFQRVGSISEVTAQLTAEKAGLTWADQPQLPLGAGAVTEAALTTDQADIVSTTPADAAGVITKGTGYLVTNPQDDATSVVANQLNSVLAAAPDFVEQYPEFTQQVVTATVSSLTDLKSATDPAVVLKTMPADFQSAVTDSWSEQWDLAKSGFTRATGGFSEAEVTATSQAAQILGQVAAGYTVPPELFDNKFVIAAYEALKTPAPSGLS